MDLSTRRLKDLEQEIALVSVRNEDEMRHRWRELLRQHEWTIVRRRRPDMADVHLTHRPSLWRQQQRIQEPQASLLKAVQCGGLYTAERRGRHDQVAVDPCHCGKGVPDVEHTLWHCDYTCSLWQPFRERMKSDKAQELNQSEKKCALPMSHRSAAFVKSLAKHAIACVELWRKRHQAETAGEELFDEEIGHVEEELAAPRPSADQVAAAVAPAPDLPRQVEPVRGALGSNIQEGGASSSNAGLEHITEEQEAGRITCQRCLASDSMRNKTRFLQHHHACSRAPRRINRGPAPKHLPGFLARLEGGNSDDGSSGARVLCTRCGAHAHWCHLAVFTQKHSLCDE